MARSTALALVSAGLVSAHAPTATARPVSLTERNRAVITAFAHRLYDQHDVRGAFEQFVAGDYVQHNPNITDGREAAVMALEPMFGAPGSRFLIKRIVVDGDTAVIHLHGRSGSQGEGGSVADIYRLERGRIVEHWDVLQPIKTGTLNPHPYF